MALFYLFGVVLMLIHVLYKYFTWSYDYWKLCNVPFEPPTALVGNMTFVLRESMAIYMQRLYKKFDAHNYFGIWLFRTPILVIRSPEMAREILVTKFNSFIDRAMETHESDTLGSNCLVVAKGEQWKQLRHRLSPAFTRAKIRNILTTRMPAIAKEFQELVDKEYTEKPTDIKNVFLIYLVEVIAGTIFGIRANSMQDKKAPILKMGMSLVDWTTYRGIEVMSIFLFPQLVKLFKFKLFTTENNDFMRALFVKILRSRQTEKIDEKAQSRDVVDALLKLKDSGSGYDFTEDDILAQAAIFFSAGYETTSTALSFMCYELAFNKEYQESLHNQIKSLKMEKTKLDLEELDNLNLLDMGIKGVKYAMLSMKMTLFSLIERYRFEPCGDTVPPKDFRMSTLSVLSAPERPIMLNIIRR